MTSNLILSLEGFECLGFQPSPHFSDNLTMQQKHFRALYRQTACEWSATQIWSNELLVLCWTLKELHLHIT